MSEHNEEEILRNIEAAVEYLRDIYSPAHEHPAATLSYMDDIRVFMVPLKTVFGYTDEHLENMLKDLFGFENYEDVKSVLAGAGEKMIPEVSK